MRTKIIFDNTSTHTDFFGEDIALDSNGKHILN
jgi:hypothetical protein